MTIGERIKAARKRCKLTQKQLAEAADVATGTIQQYELGKRAPKAEILIKLSDILEISAQYLLYGEHYGSVSAYGNGICAYSASSKQEIDMMLEDRDPNSFRIVFRNPFTVITVDNDGGASPEEIDQIIAIYDHEEYVTNEDDKFRSHLLLAFSLLNKEGQQKAIERVEELTEIPKYQKKDPQ